MSVASLVLAAALLGASDLDEFKVKREAVFEFTQRPVLTRAGDRITIAFETRGFCDVTVAVEDDKGRIIRHLASGVLGTNAPAPFQRNSRRQVIVWDGKDDQGAYIDDKDKATVRVSLGLKPQFERTLFWSPHKRIGVNSPLIAAAPGGVYVFEGSGLDSLRLYDHAGNYLRTVYPFPRERLSEAKGLDLQVFPQDGQRLPIKLGITHSTLLTSGDNVQEKVVYSGAFSAGAGGLALAAQGGRVAVVGHRLDRLSSDGTTGGLDLTGPETGVLVPGQGLPELVLPRSAAFSPDGRWVYLTGYRGASREYVHAVLRVDWAGSGKAELFAGSLQRRAKDSGTQGFCVPTAVACDAQGRVYVADYMNDRIQVFDAGKLVKSLPAQKPAWLAVHQKTGEIYVASWFVLNSELGKDLSVVPTLTRLGPLGHAEPVATYALPLLDHSSVTFLNQAENLQFRLALDSWSEFPALWLLPGLSHEIRFESGPMMERRDKKSAGLRILIEKDGKLTEERDFNTDVAASVVRTRPTHRGWGVGPRQRLHVNPVNGRLYVGEGDCRSGRNYQQLLEIVPETGKITLVDLPMMVEDLAIDVNGLFYLRSPSDVGVFDPATWREIPWDYGEDIESGGGGHLISGLILPGTPNWYYYGGMAISPKGLLAVTCGNTVHLKDRREEAVVGPEGGGDQIGPNRGRPYTPRTFPGRALLNETHIWDTHGRVAYEDAIPGLHRINGMGMDKDDNLYVLASSNRILDGKPYFLNWTQTLIKMAPKKCRVISSGVTYVPLPLPKESRPDRAPDGDYFAGNEGRPLRWHEGAQWYYGGVGYCATIWNARAALDLFARSFAPEIDHFSVAVLDTNGNLILRIGKYGNVEDGKPLVLDGGPKNPRSIGGDEVALFHAAYLGTHTDRRLFIADAGNGRILSVKLDYQAAERVPLRDVKDGSK